MQKKKHSIEALNSRKGFLFTLPWLIGFVLFFFKPILQSIAFAFSKVAVTTDGFSLKFVGFSNFNYALYKSPEYLDRLISSIKSFSAQVPVILILSLFIGVTLNSKFRGKTLFRAIYFIPVIIASGVVMDYIGGDSVMESMRAVGGGDAELNTYADMYIDFGKMFLGLGLPEKLTSVILGYANDIYNLVWNCGIQIVLFISGLQSIPEQLYEVSKVEGATKWEEFWKITIPMLGNTIVLATVYTVIEFCVSTDNPVIKQAYTMLLDKQIYGQASAMLWIYFVISMGLTGAFIFLFYRAALRKWQ